MRLVIVSNRLPVTAEYSDGKLKLEASVGGLATGLSSYLNSQKSSATLIKNCVWVGWPGMAAKAQQKAELAERLRCELDAYPVFLTATEVEKFYYGFSNKTLWPLFHYFPSLVSYSEEYWSYYKRVNNLFAEALLGILEPDDIVWVHDYQLMLLPKLIKDKVPRVPVGFFLHIPFPSFELFRLLPGTWRREILEHLVSADLIGFHTYSYAQYFLRSLLLILGYEHNLGRVLAGGHLTKVDVFPMSIDYQKYHQAAQLPEVQQEIQSLLKKLGDSSAILSVDRLDYSKGILNRLQGFELFLERRPEWHGRVVLIAVVAPSRTGVELYQHMKRQIDELIGKINGRFGGIHWTPILYQYKQLSFESLAPLYAVSDVCLVTPLRDGMNLIAKEYVASDTEGQGVLILSEMAGAAAELGEAVIINPNNLDEIAESMKAALTMPKIERRRRNRILQERVKQYDVVRWASDFINTLLAVREESQRLETRLLGTHGLERLAELFAAAGCRLLLLDYDGTLRPFVDQPQLAQPTKEILQILGQVARVPQTDVVLVSGRDRGTLENWFGQLDLAFVAEHGAWVKERRRAWRTLGPLHSDWKKSLRPILERYAGLVSGSFVEEKEYSLVWHYRRAEPELAPRRAKELTDELIQFTANLNVQVLQGHKIVEIRNVGVDKGAAARHFATAREYDFILAVGDDWTDEDMFQALPEQAHTIRVGITTSHARFHLHDSSDVIALLTRLIS